MDPEEIRLDKLDCVHLYQDRKFTGSCKQTWRLRSTTLN